MRIPRAFADAQPLFEIALKAGLEMVPVTGPGWEILDCDMTKQEKTEWCWSSVTQTVERRHGRNESQCEIARDVIGSTFCGSTCSTVTCNQPQPLSAVLQIRGRRRQRITTPIDFDQIKTEIRDEKAVICLRIDRAPNGHAIIICGFSEATGKRRVAILDPSKSVASGPQAHDYDQLLVKYDAGGTWDETCLTQ
jgi:Peptidase_C39 like family